MRITVSARSRAPIVNIHHRFGALRAPIVKHSSPSIGSARLRRGLVWARCEFGSGSFGFGSDWFRRGLVSFRLGFGSVLARPGLGLASLGVGSARFRRGLSLARFGFYLVSIRLGYGSARFQQVRKIWPGETQRPFTEPRFFHLLQGFEFVFSE